MNLHSRRRSADWNRLATQTDKEIAAAAANDPDAAPVDEAFWNRTPIVRGSDGRVAVALDANVVRWLRKKQDGDARVNALLRSLMETETRPPAKKRKVGR